MMYSWKVINFSQAEYSDWNLSPCVLAEYQSISHTWLLKINHPEPLRMRKACFSIEISFWLRRPIKIFWVENLPSIAVFIDGDEGSAMSQPFVQMWSKHKRKSLEYRRRGHRCVSNPPIIIHAGYVEKTAPFAIIIKGSTHVSEHVFYAFFIPSLTSMDRFAVICFLWALGRPVSVSFTEGIITSSSINSTSALLPMPPNQSRICADIMGTESVGGS